MRISVLTGLFALIFFQISFGQGPNPHHAERIKAMRVAVFTETLQLSPEEAQVFWPLFNEFQAKKDALEGRLRPDRKLEGLSDKELETQLANYFEWQQKELDLQKEYSAKFRKVLPLRKVVMIPMAERNFRETLLKRIAERRGQRAGERQ